MFGIDAGSNNLTGQSNAAVAALFQEDFVLKGVKLDAQVLATALNVYVTKASLDSTGVAAHYGFTVSDHGVGTATVSIGRNGDAFGVANNSTLEHHGPASGDRRSGRRTVFSTPVTRQNARRRIASTALSTAGSAITAYKAVWIVSPSSPGGLVETAGAPGSFHFSRAYLVPCDPYGSSRMPVTSRRWSLLARPAAAESDHREQHEILPKEQCVRGPVSITTAKVSDFALIGPVSRRQTNEEFVTTSCRTMRRPDPLR